MFKNPFSFNGRIRRTEFGITFIIYLICYFVALALIDAQQISVLLLLIPLLWFLWAQGAKRCHDLGKSGWWQIIPFYALWMLFADSQPGENQYGPDPKGRANSFDEYDYLVNKSPDGAVEPESKVE